MKSINKSTSTNINNLTLLAKSSAADLRVIMSHFSGVVTIIYVSFISTFVSCISSVNSFTTILKLPVRQLLVPMLSLVQYISFYLKNASTFVYVVPIFKFLYRIA